jgi:zinc transport system permease protein
MLQYAFMQRALLAAVLVGVTAPTVGVHLVQRRLALIGDGLGHVALAGVAVGVLTSNEPVLTALVAAVLGALAIEVIRYRGRTSGDIALAILFYGGIAGGVVIISQAEGGTPANLNSYLFGAITTTTTSDVATFALLSAVVLLITLGLGRYLFAVSHDEEFARAAGLPVLALNLALALVTAVTVVVSMRVIGLLLISALMIVPVATAQLVARSFRATVAISIALGLLESSVGVWVSYETDTPSGGTIVLTAIAVFLLVALASSAWRVLPVSRRPPRPGGGSPPR